MFALMEEDLFGTESHAAYDPMISGLQGMHGGNMASEPLDAQTAAFFQAELERLLNLRAGEAADLEIVRKERDALRRRAKRIMAEADGFVAKRDDILEAMKDKTIAIKTSQNPEKQQKLKAALKADYALGAMFDQKAGELMDQYFEIMALESEVSSYFSILQRSEK